MKREFIYLCVVNLTTLSVGHTINSDIIGLQRISANFCEGSRGLL